MRISAVRQAISKFIERDKYQREQYFIKRMVSLDGDMINRDAYLQLDEARKTLANYAFDKGVHIDIASARKNPNSTKEDAGKIAVRVTDMFTLKTTQKTLDADVNKIYPYREKDYIVINHEKDGIQHTKIFDKLSCEDTFLRHVYRQISEMAKTVRQGK
jgi:hypothetical protein